jgi:hypothetical protein
LTTVLGKIDRFIAGFIWRSGRQDLAEREEREPSSWGMCERRFLMEAAF